MRSRPKGVITVFFTLCCSAFLGLFFMLTESVRVQGARTQAVNITDMGNYSVFSEFERSLLDRYDLFAFDGAYGGSSFSEDRIYARLRSFMERNASPAKEGLSMLCFDPWQLQISSGRILEYALLTDEGGCGFYQQAVSFMKNTAVMNVTGKLYEYYTQAEEMDRLQEAYEKAKQQSDADMEDAQEQEEQMMAELSGESGEVFLPPGESMTDPLKELARVIAGGIWENVRGSIPVSSRKVPGWDLASHRLLQRGTLKVEEKYGSITDDLIFREYLLDHFPNYLSETEEDPGQQKVLEDAPSEEALKCQAEYILAGKRSDLLNMKAVALRLVLLREGANYLYSISDPGMNAAASQTAFLLIGWTGIPALVSTLKHALLLGWSYGESLVDVRTLLEGGRVPLKKSGDTWTLTLTQLGNLSGVLAEGGKDRGRGLRYRDYLRILLDLGSVRQQTRRGLDLIELTMRSVWNDSFCVDHCVVALTEEVSWKIHPLFSRIPGAFLKVSGGPWEMRVKAGFSYL